MKSGYGQFSRTVPGERLQTHYAHRVSYEIFVGAVPEGLFVLHSCDRPICVQPACLELGTNLKNMRDAAERERVEKGEDKWNAKLTEDDVRMIRESPLTQTALSRLLGTDPSTISDVRRGVTWKHVA